MGIFDYFDVFLRRGMPLTLRRLLLCSTTPPFGHPLKASPSFPHHSAESKQAFPLRSFLRQIYIEGELFSPNPFIFSSLTPVPYTETSALMCGCGS